MRRKTTTDASDPGRGELSREREERTMTLISPHALFRMACDDHWTGQMFVVTADNRQVRIGFEAGHVVHIGYGPRRGTAAAEMVSTSTAQAATFEPGLVSLRDDDLPGHDALRALLEPFMQRAPADSGDRYLGVPTLMSPLTGAPAPTAPPAQAPPAAPANRMPPSPPLGALDARLLHRLKALMVDQVGPMGELLVNEKISAGVRDMDALIDQLAPEVGGPRRELAFREAVKRLKR